MKRSNPPAQIVQGLESGLNCLLHLVSLKRPVGSRELARHLGLEPTRVNRLLKTLSHLGFAAQTPDKKYIAGSGVNILAALGMRSSPLLNVALPHVSLLTQKLKKVIALGVLWNGQVCYLYHGKERGAMISGHCLYPAERSSIGLSLLAHYNEVELEELYPGREDVLRRLAEVRDRGYAVGDSNSIAVCIGGSLQLGGLAVSDADPQSDDIPFLVRELNLCAEQICQEWRKY